MKEFVVNKVKQYREERGMTQEELAQKIGISYKQMYNIEKCTNTSMYIAKKLKKALGKKLDDLFPD